NECHNLRLYLQFTQFNQCLPGAVVLYNDFGNQRLFTSNYQFKADYRGKLKKLGYRIHWNHLHDSLKYTDPDYLNSSGQLVSSFVTSTHNGGITFSLNLWKRLALNWGTEEVSSRLRSRESLDAQPERWQNFAFLKASYTIANYLIIAQIGHQSVLERNEAGTAANN